MTTPRNKLGPRHLFSSWPQVDKRLRAAGGWLLLLDFDGTLVPLENNPNGVSLEPAVRQILGRLVRQSGWSVYIMSGRRLADLRPRVKVRGIHLLGLHGWETRGATLPVAQQLLLLQAKTFLAHGLPRPPEIELEDKGCALAVHYRGARPPAVRAAKKVMLDALENFQPGLYLLKGKQIWELLPGAIAGKGLATLNILSRLPADTLPIYIGDDISDEGAFAVMPHGLAVHVGARTKTHAQFFLRNPGEVREFLERLENVIPRP
jgi:trehalose 6-phosphate phosphatase